MIAQAIFHTSVYGSLFIAAMAIASGQDAQSASKEAGNAGSDVQATNMIADVQRAIVAQTNEFRKSNQLNAVQRDEHLMQAAKNFAEFMARTGKYGHRVNGTTPAQRAESADYEYCVVRENIAYRTNTGQVTADSLIELFVQGWIDSPPHRENMLANFITDTGVAVATNDGVTYYAVQMFGRPKSAAFRIRLNNETSEMKTIVCRANDQQEEFELQPRAILTMTRCLPTELSLAGSEAFTHVDSTATLKVTSDGLLRSGD